MKTTKELLASAAAILQIHGIENPMDDAKWLLAELTKTSFNAVSSLPFNTINTEKFLDQINKRASKIPLDYIIGHTPFLNTHINVDENVLIPRNETEWMVSEIIKHLATLDLKNKNLLDLCTGSGAIAIAIKKRFPVLNTFMADISPKALNVAKNNAELNGVEVTPLLGDLFAPCAGLKFDFIIANPPYVAEGEWPILSPEVQKEPKSALLGGADGLDFYRRIHKEAPPFLSDDAKIWLEIGSGQGPALLEIFGSGTLFRDLYGKARVFSLKASDF